MIFLSCSSDNDETAEMEVIISQDTEDTEDKEGFCIQHGTETISEDQVWKTGEIHCISGFLSIKDAIVTIEPGTEVRLMKNASIEVGFNAGESAIVAEGTAQKPILFTSGEDNPHPGDWVAIKFLDGASSQNILKHCVLEYGGSDVFTSDQVGMVELKYGGTAIIENSIMRNSLTHALKSDFSSPGFTSFTGNTITTAGDFAIAIHAPQVHTIGTNNVIDNKGIWVGSGYVDQNVTWNKQTCPYEIHGLSVGSASGNFLTIEEGTIIKMDFNGISVGTDGKIGGLIANATVQNPITFTSSLQNPAPGDWSNITFGPDTMVGTIMNHSLVEYANGNSSDYAAIEISSDNVTITNTHITNCSGIGILQNNSFTEFSNNTVTDTGSYPIKINAPYVNSLGSGNQCDTTYPIYVTGGKISGLSNLWRNHSTAYQINGNLLLGPTGTTDTEMTIEAGCELKFTTNSGMTIANSYPVLFKAQGTVDNPILFTSAEASGTESPGDWDGLEFYDRLVAGSQLNYCNVSYGGERYANIYAYGLTADKLQISNCNITNSSKYGISLSGGASPTMNNNTFANNALGDTN